MSGSARQHGARAAWPALAPALIALACAAFTPAAAAAETISALQQRGAEIYHMGKSASGQPVIARIGGADVPLPGTALACAGCHGPDGGGRPEGGIEPVPLTWDHLTKPYGHRHASGREHPPFSEATLKRAITLGIDPAGNRLDPAMPRFDMAAEDLDALIAYLKQLGSGSAPGVTATTIALGMLVAGEGPLAAAGDAAAALVEAYLADINGEAALYGRTVALRIERLPGDPTAGEAALDRLIEAPVLALLAAVPPPLQARLAARAEAAAVPTVHLWPPTTEAEPDGRRYSFYLLAGLRQEVEALVRFAEEPLVPGRPRAALLVSPTRRAGPEVEAVARRWPDAARAEVPAAPEEARGLARALYAEGADLLFILAGDEGVATLLHEAAAIGWAPTLLAPGSLAGGALRGLPAGFGGKVFIAHPMASVDRSEDRLAKLAALRVDGETRHVFAEATAYAAASVLVEALRLAGRGVSRDALIAAMESLHRFRTGVVPPLSYGPNRRIGAAEPRLVRAR
jgi:ABC-type branched-subunit amino acid transport system substrate-binding protein